MVSSRRTAPMTCRASLRSRIAMPKLPPIKPTPTMQTVSNMNRWLWIADCKYCSAELTAPLNLHRRVRRLPQSALIPASIARTARCPGLLAVAERVFGMRMNFDNQVHRRRRRWRLCSSRPPCRGVRCPAMGSMMIGRCDAFLIAGTADKSSVKRVLGS